MNRTATTAAAAIAEPGRNCWCVERADRFAVLPDGEYYRRFRDAALRATDTIFILAWDITGATELVPNLPADGHPTRLDEFIRYLAKRRPALKINILTWDYGLLFTMERDPFSRWHFGWRMPRNVRFGFDDHHPIGGCHHQKVVVIDDTLAFSGSMDLTGHRWDTPAHRVDEPGRLDPKGRPYSPYHEVQAMADGPIAARLGVLARDRWAALGAKQLPPPAAPGPNLWPEDLEPDFTDIGVTIARTCPTPGDEPSVLECETHYLDAIAQARHTIYIENQYFTHKGIGDALAARLREADGPEVVLVLPVAGDGWLEQNTIEVFRKRLFQQLAEADRRQRLRIVHPTASRGRDVETFVHSKVLIVDDRLVRIGSANSNHRSMGMDTECDLAVEGDDDRARTAILRCRARLVAEHLGLDADDVFTETARLGSLRALIDAHQHADRALVPFDIENEPEPPPDSTVHYVVDPDVPMDLGASVDQWLPAADAPTGRMPLRVWISPAVALLGAAAVAWASISGAGQTGLESLQSAIGSIRAATTVDAIAVVLFLVAGLALVPLELILVVAGVLLGTSRGILVAVGGSLAIAVAGYVAGRLLGAAAIANWMSRKSYRSGRQLGSRGLMGVAVLRLAGVASASAVHLLCGAAGVPFLRYLAGTAIGLVPAIVALTALGGLLGDTLLDPSTANAATTIGAGLLVLACAIALRAVLLIRQFAPSLSRHRQDAEFG